MWRSLGGSLSFAVRVSFSPHDETLGWGDLL